MAQLSASRQQEAARTRPKRLGPVAPLPRRSAPPPPLALLSHLNAFPTPPGRKAEGTGAFPATHRAQQRGGRTSPPSSRQRRTVSADPDIRRSCAPPRAPRRRYHPFPGGKAVPPSPPRSPPPGNCPPQESPERRGGRAVVALPPAAPARTRHPPLPPSWAPRAAASSERPLRDVSAAQRPNTTTTTPSPHGAGIPAPVSPPPPRAGGGRAGKATLSWRGSAARYPPTRPPRAGPCRHPTPTCRARDGKHRSPCAGGGSVTRFVASFPRLLPPPPASPAHHRQPRGRPKRAGPVGPDAGNRAGSGRGAAGPLPR
ncbi:uncharacterized protein LOC128971271 [Indicator indicator]|uniref:uncharacterized protein LOC128971271 n=1 Tax=Indicator indicator TaxID=1002788 RepID=UPI0023E048D8|nr:uncharacterized protein LOC128971271 [Indicator indicator]